MTGRWLTLTAAASRIADATKRHVSIDDVKLLGMQGRLVVRFEHEHFSVLEKSVNEYLTVSELAAHGGDDLAENGDRPKPAWKPWSSADDPEARDEQADYDDTPNEEGDETPCP